jgi:hypothetical protein
MTPAQREALARLNAAHEKRVALEIAECESVVSGEVIPAAPARGACRMRSLAWFLVAAIFVAVVAYILAAQPDPTPLLEQVDNASQFIGGVL